MSLSNPQTSYTHTTFPPSSFWGRRRNVIRSKTLLAQLHMLKKTGRYDAFKLKWHPIYNDPPIIWPVPRHLFWDSDVAKWIEGACYFIKDMEPSVSKLGDDEIKLAVNELVEMIRGAQQDDGYLNIHFTVVDPKGRWKNLRDLHELYNAGHLIEAALAHHYCFQDTRLLAPILKYVDLLCKTFGPGSEQMHGYPGHPEIELALLRLFRLTRDPKHLYLSRYFIDERGNPDSGGTGRHYYDIEKEARGERAHEWPEYMPVRVPYRYNQAHKPLTEQETVEGHSVRAMYLLTGVADLSVLEKSSRDKYAEALHRLWNNVVRKRMYMTGGIGAIPAWEGFGQDYFLPQGDDEGADGGGAYLETCAAIGVVMLAERLLHLELKSQYADIMELCLYNAVLTGMAHDGAAFTYVNQLASSDGNPSKRSEWFEVSCCPPNVSRLLGSIGGYVWTVESTADACAVNVHLYTAAMLKLQTDQGEMEIKQRTNLPYGDGSVVFSVRNGTARNLSLRLRIPGWATSWEIIPDVEGPVVDGYLLLSPEYVKSNPDFELKLFLQPRFTSPHPFTNQHVAAVARGPLIYCVEDVDNPWVDDHFKTVLLDTSVLLHDEVRDDIFEDESITGIRAENAASFLLSMEYNPVTDGPQNWKLQERRRETLRFIPYYARANRGGKGMMRVGLRIK